MDNGHTPQDHSYLAHHFSEPQQQHESAKLGMWIFLLTEILLFGGLFVAYTIYRVWQPDMFYNAHKYLDVYLGTFNTIVLITSSVTMALAIRSIQLNDRKKSIALLVATLLLAGTFLVVKYFEYSHKFHLGQLPGKYYTFTGVEGDNPHIFFSIYFAMTGLHGIHVILGMCVIGWILRRTIKGDFSSDYYTPMEMTGLYWHLVDLIWIYLFPLLYLIG
ncbi:MAG: cytochrome c oxidase subunit 3 family protein [candidate division Zixibacteria bacterium]|nr:cytochrome c oxidase subunit 3 family protein [candidate division Zixibacteria bacterium]